MKNITLILSIYLFSISIVNAQDKKESREKIRTLKIAYLTEQLNLTTKEAEKFWPIYNSFDKEKQLLKSELRAQTKKVLNDANTLEHVSDEVAERLVNLKLSTDKKILEIETLFVSKIQKIISYPKIIQLQFSEMEFGRKLMHKYRKKRKL